MCRQNDTKPSDVTKSDRIGSKLSSHGLIGNDLWDEIVKPSTLYIILLLGTVHGLVGILITNMAITSSGLRYAPVLGVFIASGVALISGAGTLRAIVCRIRSYSQLTSDARQIVLKLNAITALVSIILWCLYVLVFFSAMLRTLGLH